LRLLSKNKDIKPYFEKLYIQFLKENFIIKSITYEFEVKDFCKTFKIVSISGGTSASGMQAE